MGVWLSLLRGRADINSNVGGFTSNYSMPRHGAVHHGQHESSRELSVASMRGPDKLHVKVPSHDARRRFGEATCTWAMRAPLLWLILEKATVSITGLEPRLRSTQSLSKWELYVHGILCYSTTSR